MHIPKFWERVEGAATDPEDNPYRLNLWGWSDDSPAAALAAAKERLAEVIEKITRGDELRSHYYGFRPTREEIIRAIGEPDSVGHAVVTRNRYGCLVLNTAQVPLIDVDIPTDNLVERVKRWWNRDRPTAEARTLDQIRDVCGQHREYGYRIYRTRAGFRVLVTNRVLDPTLDESKLFLEEFGADPAFVRLCSVQRCFRARLTPKPWRCDFSRPPCGFPRDWVDDREFQKWQAQYDSVIESFATCHFVETAGAREVDDATRPLIEEHDEVTRATSGLPLA